MVVFLRYISAANLLHSWSRYRWMARQAKTGRGIEATVQIRCSGLLDEHLTMGKGTFVDRGAIIYIGCEVNPKSSIKLAECVYVAPYVFVGSCHRLEIGNDTMIGAHTYITTVNPTLPGGKTSHIPNKDSKAQMSESGITSG